MINKKKIAIFASGGGSNFQTIAKKSLNNNLNYDVDVLICDNKDAKVINKAKDLGIDTIIVNPKEFNSKQEFESKIRNKLSERKIDLVVLAGYMRIISKELLYHFKILNIHPSLLPKHPGANGIKDSFNSQNDKDMGITIHWVDEGIDTGKIIFQKGFDKTGMTIDEAEKMIHKIEHENYWQVISDVVKELK